MTSTRLPTHTVADQDSLGAVKRPSTAVGVESRLDEPVRVISLRLWAVVLAILLAVLGAGTWAVFGSLPQRLNLPAAVLHGAGPTRVLSSASGRVVGVAVTVGDRVSRGQPLVTVATSGRATADRVVRAPADGIVLALPIGAGEQLSLGVPVAVLDPVTEPLVAELFLTDQAVLGGVPVGASVLLRAGAALVTGQVSGVQLVPLRSAAIADQLVLPITQLPATGPVWVVDVVLDAGQQVPVITGATAILTLPSIRPYRLVFGS